MLLEFAKLWAVPLDLNRGCTKRGLLGKRGWFKPCG